MADEQGTPRPKSVRRGPLTASRIVSEPIVEIATLVPQAVYDWLAAKADVLRKDGKLNLTVENVATFELIKAMQAEADEAAKDI